MSRFGDIWGGGGDNAARHAPTRLAMSRICDSMGYMNDALVQISDRARGVATEKRYSQQRVADVLGLSRSAVNDRLNGKVPFGAHELMTLATEFNVPVTRFFPETVQTHVRAA